MPRIWISLVFVVICGLFGLNSAVPVSIRPQISKQLRAILENGDAEVKNNRTKRDVEDESSLEDEYSDEEDSFEEIPEKSVTKSNDHQNINLQDYNSLSSLFSPTPSTPQETAPCLTDAKKEHQRYTSSFVDYPNNSSKPLSVESDFSSVVGGESDVVRTSSVHQGEDITLCWIETTTIKEDRQFRPPKRLVIREYTISLENSATIPEKYVECNKIEGELRGNDSDIAKTALFEVIDEDTRVSRLVNFTRVSHIGDLVEYQHRKVKCGVGPVVTKNVIEWKDGTENPKKRIEIKVSPKINRLNEGEEEVCPFEEEGEEGEVGDSSGIESKEVGLEESEKVDDETSAECDEDSCEYCEGEDCEGKTTKLPGFESTESTGIESREVPTKSTKVAGGVETCKNGRCEGKTTELPGFESTKSTGIESKQVSTESTTIAEGVEICKDKNCQGKTTESLELSSSGSSKSPELETTKIPLYFTNVSERAESCDGENCETTTQSMELPGGFTTDSSIPSQETTRIVTNISRTTESVEDCASGDCERVTTELMQSSGLSGPELSELPPMEVTAITRNTSETFKSPKTCENGSCAITDSSELPIIETTKSILGTDTTKFPITETPQVITTTLEATGITESCENGSCLQKPMKSTEFPRNKTVDVSTKSPGVSASAEIPESCTGKNCTEASTETIQTTQQTKFTEIPSTESPKSSETKSTRTSTHRSTSKIKKHQKIVTKTPAIPLESSEVLESCENGNCEEEFVESNLESEEDCNDGNCSEDSMEFGLSPTMNKVAKKLKKLKNTMSTMRPEIFTTFYKKFSPRSRDKKQFVCKGENCEVPSKESPPSEEQISNEVSDEISTEDVTTSGIFDTREAPSREISEESAGTESVTLKNQSVSDFLSHSTMSSSEESQISEERTEETEETTASDGITDTKSTPAVEFHDVKSTKLPESTISVEKTTIERGTLSSGEAIPSKKEFTTTEYPSLEDTSEEISSVEESKSAETLPGEKEVGVSTTIPTTHMTFKESLTTSSGAVGFTEVTGASETVSRTTEFITESSTLPKSADTLGIANETTRSSETKEIPVFQESTTEYVSRSDVDVSSTLPTDPTTKESTNETIFEKSMIKSTVTTGETLETSKKANFSEKYTTDSTTRKNEESNDYDFSTTIPPDKQFSTKTFVSDEESSDSVEYPASMEEISSEETASELFSTVEGSTTSKSDVSAKKMISAESTTARSTLFQDVETPPTTGKSILLSTTTPALATVGIATTKSETLASLENSNQFSTEEPSEEAKTSTEGSSESTKISKTEVKRENLTSSAVPTLSTIKKPEITEVSEDSSVTKSLLDVDDLKTMKTRKYSTHIPSTTPGIELKKPSESCETLESCEESCEDGSYDCLEDTSAVSGDETKTIEGIASSPESSETVPSVEVSDGGEMAQGTTKPSKSEESGATQNISSVEFTQESTITTKPAESSSSTEEYFDTSTESTEIVSTIESTDPIPTKLIITTEKTPSIPRRPGITVPKTLPPATTTLKTSDSTEIAEETSTFSTIKMKIPRHTTPKFFYFPTTSTIPPDLITTQIPSVSFTTDEKAPWTSISDKLPLTSKTDAIPSVSSTETITTVSNVREDQVLSTSTNESVFPVTETDTIPQSTSTIISTIVSDYGTSEWTTPTSKESENISIIFSSVPTTAETRRSSTPFFSISSIPTTSPQHKLVLKMKLILEHVNENNEKENLVEVEKRVVLNEHSPEFHPNLLERVRSLNQSIDLETLKALLNCTSLGKLANDTKAILRQELENKLKEREKTSKNPVEVNSNEGNDFYEESEGNNGDPTDLSYSLESTMDSGSLESPEFLKTEKSQKAIPNTSVDPFKRDLVENTETPTKVHGDIKDKINKGFQFASEEGFGESDADFVENRPRNRRSLGNFEVNGFLRENLPGIEKDVSSGLGNLFYQLAKENSSSEVGSTGKEGTKVPENALSSNLLKILANPRDERVHRRKRRSTMDSEREIGRWSNERIKNTSVGSKFRSFIEFTLYRSLS